MSEHPELAASHRAEIVAERRRMQAVVQSRVGRSIDGNGRVRLDSPDALGGVLPVAFGGFSPAAIIPEGDYHGADTLAHLLDELFRRLATLEALAGGFGLAPFGTSPFGG